MLRLFTGQLCATKKFQSITRAPECLPVTELVIWCIWVHRACCSNSPTKLLSVSTAEYLNARTVAVNR